MPFVKMRQRIELAPGEDNGEGVLQETCFREMWRLGKAEADLARLWHQAGAVEVRRERPVATKAGMASARSSWDRTAYLQERGYSAPPSWSTHSSPVWVCPPARPFPGEPRDPA